MSGTVGLGSIGGVAVAVTLGGPGATLWMMLAGFLGMSLKFAEVTLAVKYRRVRADGTVTGGAMYYVPEALGRVGMPRLGKFLAGFFCVAAIGGSVTIFQVSQAYSQVREVTGFDQAFLFGLMVAIWIGIVLFGGVKRIVKWTDKLSPFMCLLYIVACLVVLGANYANILPALATIVREAFAPDAVAGGVIGALIQGFRRAAFANEAGIGSAPMAHATVRTNEPMSQGFAALMEPFLDTIIICLLTALVIVVSGVNETSSNVGIALTSDAFATVVPWFPAVLAVVAVLFALSTVLAWGYYGEQAWMWLFSESQAQPRGVPAVPVRHAVDRRHVSARPGGQHRRFVQLLHGDSEHHRHLSIDAGAARRSRQLLAARGAQERRGRGQCRVSLICGCCTGVYLVWWVLMAIKPLDFFDWVLENALVVMAVALLVSTRTSRSRSRACRTPASSCS